MHTRTLGAGLVSAVVMSLAVACEKGAPPSAPSASQNVRSSPNFSRSGSEEKLRWEIVSLVAGEVGVASALANDGSKITLTGSGTIGDDEEDHARGQGTWATFNPSGMPTGSGTYRVRELVRFEPAPGSLPDAPEGRAGLAVFSIRYSDGSRGTLVVSCHLVGTPDVVFEGVTASKGFTAFWNRMAPVDGVNANRTFFSVMNGEDD